MDILIVGAGLVGSNLGRQLADEGHDITVVDVSPELLADLQGSTDCMVIEGDGACPSVLERANIAGADMVVAVTNNDSVNIIICMLAGRYGVQRRIARVRNREYVNLDKRRGVNDAVGQLADTFINPDDIIAHAFEQYVDSPGALEVADFADGAVQLRRFAVTEDSAIAGMHIHALGRLRDQEPFLAVALDRGEETIIPTGSDEIRAGDEVTFIMPDGVQPFILPLVGRQMVEVNKVVIAGTTPAAIEVARRLESKIEQVWLIEPDQAKAEAVAADREKARVVVARPTELDKVGSEIGIDRADFFLAMTPSDELNMLSSLLAKRHGAHRTAAVVNEVNYLSILKAIGIDIVVNARLLMMSAILRFIRGKDAVSVAKLQGAGAEALEMRVNDKDRIVGKALKDIRMPRGAIIGAIKRGEDAMIPDGNTTIEVDDRVILFVLPSALERVQRLFERRGLLG
jgi:trk system potassium uptake protein TrkA